MSGRWIFTAIQCCQNNNVQQHLHKSEKLPKQDVLCCVGGAVWTTKCSPYVCHLPWPFLFQQTGVDRVFYLEYRNRKAACETETKRVEHLGSLQRYCQQKTCWCRALRMMLLIDEESAEIDEKNFVRMSEGGLMRRIVVWTTVFVKTPFSCTCRGNRNTVMCMLRQ